MSVQLISDRSLGHQRPCRPTAHCFQAPFPRLPPRLSERRQLRNSPRWVLREGQDKCSCHVPSGLRPGRGSFSLPVYPTGLFPRGPALRAQGPPGDPPRPLGEEHGDGRPCRPSLLGDGGLEGLQLVVFASSLFFHSPTPEATGGLICPLWASKGRGHPQSNCGGF